LIPLAVAADPDSLALWASLAMGLSVAGFAWVSIHLLSFPRRDKGELGIFEHQRRTLLREGSQTYRWFEPLLDYLAARRAASDQASLALLRRNLRLGGETLPWKPEEYLAGRLVEAALTGLIAAALGLVYSRSAVVGLGVGLGAGLIYVWAAVRHAHGRGQKQLKTIRRRLPFALDLMALTMEAGASFLESLDIVVKENASHPLGRQLAEVLGDIAVGRTRREALEALQQRLSDEDVTEIVFAVIKGEELGTPLSQILRSQADQMRLKRSQWAEKAAAEAQVSIVFPGLVVMVACLIIVAAPFVLGALSTPR
jgi:tight adherence protein C